MLLLAKIYVDELSEVWCFGECHIVVFDHLILNLGIVLDDVAEDVTGLDVIVFVDSML